MKILFGLLGVIAATMGVEFLGTPWYVHVMGYLMWFTGVSLLAHTIWLIKQLSFWRILIRLEFVAMLLLSIFIRTFMYEVGKEVPPSYLGYTVNSFYIIISITLIVVAWIEHNGRE